MVVFYIFYQKYLWKDKSVSQFWIYLIVKTQNQTKNDY